MNITNSDKIYIAIDLKSFYASVECVERGLDPLKAHLVVADPSRTEKTICLAVSPALKAYGIPGRARLFEVVSRVKDVNSNLKKGDEPLSYITAPPRMRLYMEYSQRIYNIYLKYVSSEDIHVYSIDEVFIDITTYLSLYKMSAKELTIKIIHDILSETGITATAGIATNMYLCKVAMDIVAKHIPADEYGVRIAELNEKTYRELLWDHTPLTDFWRVGHGYQKKLHSMGLHTMGDIALVSLTNEDLLYKAFGVNAELLIDHAWGWEPTTIDLVKKYKPESNSMSSGQVLHCPYAFENTRIVIREMADALSLDLVEKGLITDQIVLTVGYDIENIKPDSGYQGEITTDHYGRKIPKHAHGTINLDSYCSSTSHIIEKTLELFDKIVNPKLFARRINLTANHIIPEGNAPSDTAEEYEQLDLFTDYAAIEKERAKQQKKIEQEKSLQQAMLNIRKRYGKNAILKGTNLQEGATMKDRNEQVGGHKA